SSSGHSSRPDDHRHQPPRSENLVGEERASFFVLTKPTPMYDPATICTVNVVLPLRTGRSRNAAPHSDRVFCCAPLRSLLTVMERAVVYGFLYNAMSNKKESVVTKRGRGGGREGKGEGRGERRKRRESGEGG